MDRWVYSFGVGTGGAGTGGVGTGGVGTGGVGTGEIGDDDVALVGGKGAGLMVMARLGLPVPPGFIVSTRCCRAITETLGRWPPGLDDEIAAALDQLGRATGRRFGDPDNPLLVAVRSGAAVSMPGMMDTVLNLGITRAAVPALARQSGDARFAFDTYRRFLQGFGEVVLGLDGDLFVDIVDARLRRAGMSRPGELMADDLEAIADAFERMIEEETGEPVGEDPLAQLRRTIDAVFLSWNGARARAYRALYNIAETGGTAVTVQAMVFGNLGARSSSGVAFTRDPATGERRLFGEYLPEAQGEDVVSGTVTPLPIEAYGPQAVRRRGPSFAEYDAPSLRVLEEAAAVLERHYRDAQDIEFTVERGTLHLLQTRAARRTVAASIRIAVEMADEGILSRREAVVRIDPASIEQLMHPTVDPTAVREVLAAGLPASPGAASGELVFTSEDAEAVRARGRPVVLVRIETSPQDIHGMHAADGIVTARGGMTSHAAVIARGMGKPCVTGAATLKIDIAAGTLAVVGKIYHRGDVVTVDGTGGQLLAGRVALCEPQLSGHFARLMGWADEFRRLGVRANAETVQDARLARSFGADGIGLCRTEQMLAGAQHILAIRRMILSGSVAARREAVYALLPMQRRELEALFVEMHGMPVTVRLFDPPLHEFMPHDEKEIDDVAESLGLDPVEIRARVREYEEYNPTLGHRGVRLAVSYPEIAEMQARAIFEATLSAAVETGEPVVPEIVVPLVAMSGEFEFVKAIVDRIAGEVRDRGAVPFRYEVGAIVELPRAALRAGKIAEGADFLSFGTNDLTQTTYGISRDDSVSFLIEYQKKGIISRDPFVTLDTVGVGELIRLAIERARAVRPSIITALSGEHGGDPQSIRFCEEIGLNYVSCSPFRVPIARLAAAQAAIAAGL